MRCRVRFFGRRVGAIGLTHDINVDANGDAFVGEGDTAAACVEDARRKVYADGWEHVSVKSCDLPEG